MADAATTSDASLSKSDGDADSNVDYAQLAPVVPCHVSDSWLKAPVVEHYVSFRVRRLAEQPPRACSECKQHLPDDCLSRRGHYGVPLCHACATHDGAVWKCTRDHIRACRSLYADQKDAQRLLSKVERLKPRVQSLKRKLDTATAQLQASETECKALRRALARRRVA